MDAAPQRREGATLRASIYRACLDAIVAGRLAPGMRLPSARQLAAEWRVSRHTVDEALGALQADGVLERRVGAGTYVAARAPARPQRVATTPQARAALADVTRWSLHAARSHEPRARPGGRAFVAGLPDLCAFPLAAWRRLTAARLRGAGGPLLLGYVPPEGLPALQEALARHLALARGIACAPGQIAVVNGTMQAVDLVARVLGGRGAQAWIEDPGFPNVRATLAMAGLRPVPVPVDGEGLVVEAGVARAPRARLVHVTPACHYPLGTTLSARRRAALLDWARQRGAWILEDDYQAEFRHDGRAPAPLAALDGSTRVLSMGTFTNSVFPSLRLAWVVLPWPLVAPFAAVRAQLDQHSHGIAQAVLADFLDGGHYAAHLRRMRAQYAARRDLVVAALAGHGVPAAALGPAAAGMHVALHLPRAWRDRDAALACAAAGVDAMPLSRYACRARVNGLLLGYAALDERAIRDGAARLARALRQRAGWASP